MMPEATPEAPTIPGQRPFSWFDNLRLTWKHHSSHRIPHAQSVEHSSRIVRLVQDFPRAHRIQFQGVEEVDVRIDIRLGKDL